jgi:hypothetical protein
MREFMPILSKFGDLEEIDNLKVSDFYLHEQINLIGFQDLSKLFVFVHYRSLLTMCVLLSNGTK